VQIELGLVLEVYQESCGFMLEPGFEEQVAGSLLAFDRKSFLVNELEGMEIDKPVYIGQKGFKEGSKNGRPLEQHFEKRIVFHAELRCP